VKDGKPKNARLNKHAAAPVATADLVVSPAGQVVRAVIDGKPVFHADQHQGCHPKGTSGRSVL